ncbi:MAG: NarK/NasA family nitrate transporter [Deltaproteobacteria bacterium]|nr:NarK/NasA family nitrate transporter [Deltaproteobacteria bacterium]
MTDRSKAHRILAINTFSFAVCFAVWMMGGVLVTFLVDQHVFTFGRSEMGWLIGAPVLTGAILRLPVGMLADRYGGRIVFVVVMLTSAVGAFLTSFASGFWGFLVGGLCFGLAGTSFSVGVAYTSLWFPKEKQGTALGIFGAGNAGAAVTNLVAPSLLMWLTHNGANAEAWRIMPRLYAAALAVTAVIFWLFTETRLPAVGQPRTMRQALAPLRVVRVWRFGLYYFLVFGGFVALSQWLIAYYLNLYALPLATAGLLAAVFSFPSNLTRAAGGWLSDRLGARRIMYYVLTGCVVGFALLSVPRLDLFVPGQGVFAETAGKVEETHKTRIVVSSVSYSIHPEPSQMLERAGVLVWPRQNFWQTPVVAPGDHVTKKQLLAKGITHIHFQANIWIFTGILLLVGLLMGFGMAATFRYIPQYFPNEVGLVGGFVGMIGGLGGFVGPVIFGYLLGATGLWITCWLFLGALSLVCLAWMHRVVRQMMDRAAPHLARRFEGMPVDATTDQREIVCLAHGVRADVAIVHVESQSKDCRIHRVLDALDGLACKDAGASSGKVPRG